MSSPAIVMVGTSSPGGTSAVLDVYRKCGLFDRWPITYLATHVDYDASSLHKILIAARCLVSYLALLFRGDVVLLHAHTSSWGSFWRKTLFILPTFAFRRPVIFHLHSGEFMHFYQDVCGPIAKCIVRYVLDHSDRIIVLSEVWKTNISAITTNRDVISIVNPLIVDEMTMASGPRDSCTLLFLGRLVDQKGVYVLLSAIFRLASEFPDLKLLCAGDGDLLRVKSVCKDLGIDNRVKVLGWAGGSEKKELLESATALVLPSFAEGLPMSVLEAMAFALPVIATSVGGIPDLISNGREGVLVSAGSVDELQAAIELLLRNQQVREEMGRRGQEKFRREFSAEIVVPLIEKVYRELGATPTYPVVLDP